jgi:hypothetical protein
MSQMHPSAAGQDRLLEAISSLQGAKEGGAGAPTESGVEKTSDTMIRGWTGGIIILAKMCR